jgi:hypothetical protein
MTDEPRPSEETEPAGHWDRHQMEFDDRGPADEPSPTAPEDDVPGWNKAQMEFDDPGEDHATRRWIDPNEMPESEEGPTGLRANPGGGERFGDIDDDDDDS